MELNTMEDLEMAINKAIKLEEPLGIFIEMPGFQEPELITNPVVNLRKKLDYYKATYDINLQHKHAAGIRIMACIFD